MPTIALPTSLAERIRFYRVIKKWSVAQLAREVGCATTDMWRLEKGIQINPTIHKLQKIARALGVTTAHLTGELDLLSGFSRPEDAKG